MSSLLTTLILHDALFDTVIAKDGEFDESKHPRDEKGRFAESGGGGAGPGVATRNANVARAALFQGAKGDPDKLVEAARRLAARGLAGPATLAFEAGAHARYAGLGEAKIADVERRAERVARDEQALRQQAQPAATSPIVRTTPPGRGDPGFAPPAAGAPEDKMRQYQEAVRAAGRDPAKLAEAARLGARLGLGGVKTLARGAKQQAERAGRGLPPQHPEFKVRTGVRAQDLARSAVQHELGIKPKPRAPKAPKADMGAGPANKPPVAPAKPPGAPVKPAPPPESAGGAGRQLSFAGTGFEHPQMGLALHPAAAAAAGDRPAGVDEAEHHLLTSKVVSQELIKGSNLNEARFVTFEDGSRGVFKPQEPASWTNPNGESEYGIGADKGGARDNITPGLDMQREALAYRVAKIVGMTDMVPPTVLRTFAKDEGPPGIRGRAGSLQQFVPNSQPAVRSSGLFGRRVVSDKPPYDGSTDFARAAVFDYAMGNEDRHPGNWMVDKTSGKLHLIDHGLIAPEGESIRPVRGFMANAGLEGSDAYDIGTVPPVVGSPRQFAEPFIQNKDAVLSALTNMGLPKSSVNGVGTRIDDLTGWNRKSDWRGLRT